MSVYPSKLTIYRQSIGRGTCFQLWWRREHSKLYAALFVNRTQIALKVLATRYLENATVMTQ